MHHITGKSEIGFLLNKSFEMAKTGHVKCLFITERSLYKVTIFLTIISAKSEFNVNVKESKCNKTKQKKFVNNLIAKQVTLILK